MAKNEITVPLTLDGSRLASRLRRIADVLEGPDFGDRIEDGGMLGTIVRCEMCGGSGQLHDPDDGPPEPVAPEDGS